MARKNQTRKLELDTTNDQELEVVCDDCRRPTNHRILRSVEVIGNEQHGQWMDIDWNDWYQIVRCLGCGTISFRKAHENSLDSPDVFEDGSTERVIREELFPPRDFGRQELNDLECAPDQVQLVYRETLRALNGNQPVLAGVGIRALLETICKAKRAKGQSLFKKIDSLVELGALSKDGAKILHRLRVLGNQAAHEVKPHSPKQLAVAIDVIDHLIEGVYILPHRARTELSGKKKRLSKVPF